MQSSALTPPTKTLQQHRSADEHSQPAISQAFTENFLTAKASQNGGQRGDPEETSSVSIGSPFHSLRLQIQQPTPAAKAKRKQKER